MLKRNSFFTGCLMTLLFSLLCIFVFKGNETHVLAATGYQGYAVYRDGVILNIEWHAGLMDEPFINSNVYPVMHIGGSGQTVNWVTWPTFMGGNNTYKGVYKPKSGITSAGRDLVTGTSRQLRLQSIPYSALNMLSPVSGLTGTWIYPYYIATIRCDGVVEYAYEWNNYVIGGGTNWDISANTSAARSAHNLSNITPKKQAQNHMNLVTSSLPN